jgi:DNA mismatch endonuclease (patch repair protein)
MVDIMSKKKRSALMSRIRGKNTKIEIKIRNILCKAGIKGYRLNKKIYGNPDIVFPKYKVAIFCDGDFWHGYAFHNWKNKPPPFWTRKISGNIKRDKLVNTRLKKEGWGIIRLWEHAIKKDEEKCKKKIIDILKSRGYRI